MKVLLWKAGKGKDDEPSGYHLYRGIEKIGKEISSGQISYDKIGKK